MSPINHDSIFLILATARLPLLSPYVWLRGRACGCDSLEIHLPRASGESHGRCIFSTASFLDILRNSKIHSSKVPQRLPSSRCIENAPALWCRAFHEISSPDRFRYSTKTSRDRYPEDLSEAFSEWRTILDKTAAGHPPITPLHRSVSENVLAESHGGCRAMKQPIAPPRAPIERSRPFCGEWLQAR